MVRSYKKSYPQAMQSIKQRITLLGLLTKLGFALLALGFLALSLHALGIKIIPQSFIVPILAIGFILSITCSSLLSFTRCPACKKPFIGNTSQGESLQKQKLFTKVCRHCGYTPK
jgi:hypothetical protein